MKSNTNKVMRAASVLILGLLLTGGGLFLWQNQFNIIFSPKASTNVVQAVIVLGESSGTQQSFGKLVVEELNKASRKKIELVSRAETGIVTTSLRDQTVFGYNDVTKPITDHIYFLAVTGKSSFVTALKTKEPTQVAANRVSKEITDMIELAISRPGVFPDGFTVFLAQFPDPLGKTGNTSLCKGSVANQDAAYTKQLLSDINIAMKNLQTIYPQYIRLIDTDAAFATHAIGQSEPWFSTCLALNTTGEEKLAELFTAAISANTK